MLLHVVLRSPLAFKLRAPPSIDWMKQPPDAVGITFEGVLFVWHPPMNVLDAVYDVRRETERGAVTQEASARDAFIEGAAQAGSFASRPTPDDGWAAYFRDEVRNDVAHIIRDEGKKQVNPDAPVDRQPAAGGSRRPSPRRGAMLVERGELDYLATCSPAHPRVRGSLRPDDRGFAFHAVP